MIKVQNLSKDYFYYERKEGFKASFKGLFWRKEKKNEALKDVNFSISEGEFVGYIGPNGAGKTTTLKLLSGILFPTEGEAQVLGFTPWRGEEEYKRQISFVMGQKGRLWWDLPAIETFALHKEIYQIPNSQYQHNLEELVELLGVKNLLNIQVRRLSLGERMKMEIAVSLLHSPKVIFLDEPTIGLDITSRRNMWDFFIKYNRSHKATIVLTSHYLEDVKKLCKRVIVINKGEIIYDGKLSRLTKEITDYKLISFHFLNDRQKTISFLSRDGEADIVHIGRNDAVIKIQRSKSPKIIQGYLRTLEISEINIADPPIEDVIQKLYKE